MKLLTPDKVQDLAPHLISTYLQRAAHWTLKLAETSPRDADNVRRQFEHQCQQTVYKLRGQLKWKK